MKIHELLSDESKWTKGAYARDANGSGSVSVTDESAICWCLTGAMRKCYGGGAEWSVVRDRLAKAIGDTEASVGSIPAWNDDPSRTFAHVKALVTSLNI